MNNDINNTARNYVFLTNTILIEAINHAFLKWELSLIVSFPRRGYPIVEKRIYTHPPPQRPAKPVVGVGREMSQHYILQMDKPYGLKLNPISIEIITNLSISKI